MDLFHLEHSVHGGDHVILMLFCNLITWSSLGSLLHNVRLMILEVILSLHCYVSPNLFLCLVHQGVLRASVKRLYHYKATELTTICLILQIIPINNFYRSKVLKYMLWNIKILVFESCCSIKAIEVDCITAFSPSNKFIFKRSVSNSKAFFP